MRKLLFRDRLITISWDTALILIVGCALYILLREQRKDYTEAVDASALRTIEAIRKDVRENRLDLDAVKKVQDQIKAEVKGEP